MTARRKTSLPDAGAITPDALITLDVAAKLGFPDNTMSAKSLRNEIDRGRLRAWKIGGRIFTKLSEIEAMQEACMMEPKALPPDVAPPRPPRPGSAAASMVRFKNAVADLKK